jgi:hypothetical protein
VAYFHLKIDTDFPGLGDGRANPFELAEIGLETVTPIDGDFNIEVEATGKASVECSFPSTHPCQSGTYREQGKKFRPMDRRRGFSVRKLPVFALFSSESD